MSRSKARVYECQAGGCHRLAVPGHAVCERCLTKMWVAVACGAAAMLILTLAAAWSVLNG